MLEHAHTHISRINPDPGGGENLLEVSGRDNFVVRGSDPFLESFRQFLDFTTVANSFQTAWRIEILSKG
ncbi:hypothetical protein E2C01_083286 [Portunus trituberculatus]|uniref:Uncharacterized protein n=1 Tax=Portunus trituberculatus TaxID=210409 RepID=A0A5B7J0T2_PORTR|nr:hypothetical protein [Portunus trituberculatus]